METRLLYQSLWASLSEHKQMVFISGPRQSGKTTFANLLAKKYANSLYFNWDIIDNKKKLIENPYFYEDLDKSDNSIPLIIFDEIHKYENWKNYLKGAYDRDSANFKFLITGSGRLNIYKKRGDSLAGRYLHFHLWPFTVSELSRVNKTFKEFKANPLKLVIKQEKKVQKIWNNLSELSGFPDPYISGKKNFYNIWSETYRQQLIREDIRDLTGIHKLDQIEILYAMLPSKIASPISMNKLAKQIGVSFDSIKSWLQIFDNYFLSFRLSPWSKRISRSILKEKKLYLFDYPAIENLASRFENMIALELLRLVTSLRERGIGKFDLHYIRNKEKEEVDFLITENKEPFILIEAKLADVKPAHVLKKIQNNLKVPAIQLVNTPGVNRVLSNGQHKILVVTANQWLAQLP